MPIKVLAILPAFIPSTTIDVISPLIDLHKEGMINARITLEVFAKDKDINWCDVVILCRNTEPSIAEWFLRIIELQKPYIYDIDDNFFEIPRNTTLGKFHRHPQRIAILKEYIRLAQLVRVYSAPMFERAKSLNENVSKVTAPVDWRLISNFHKTDNSDIVKFVYATSRSDDHLAEIFKPALKRILEKYSDNIRMFFLGYIPLEFQKYKNVVCIPPVFNYEKYLRSFSSAGYDIGLAPLLNDVFHRSKTNNKFREYGASKIAGIYSDVDVYSNCVINKKTGILVKNNPAAWYDAMELLIKSKSLRLKIQTAAFEFTKQNYSQIAYVNLWQQQISEVSTYPLRKKKLRNSVENLIRDYINPKTFWGINFFLWIFKKRIYKKKIELFQQRILNFIENFRIFRKRIRKKKLKWYRKRILNFFGNLQILVNGIHEKRLGWYQQRILNFFGNLRTYGLSYEIAKISHYIRMLWMLWTIRIQLRYIRTKRN